MAVNTPALTIARSVVRAPVLMMLRRSVSIILRRKESLMSDSDRRSRDPRKWKGDVRVRSDILRLLSFTQIVNHCRNRVSERQRAKSRTRLTRNRDDDVRESSSDKPSNDSIRPRPELIEILDLSPASVNSDNKGMK